MADEREHDSVVEEPKQPQFQLQKIYTKDVSFELPNAPEIFQDDGQVEIKMNLAQRVENLAEGVQEVVLTVTVTASLGEKTAYLARGATGGYIYHCGFGRKVTARGTEHLVPAYPFPICTTGHYRSGRRWWSSTAGITADQFRSDICTASAGSPD